MPLNIQTLGDLRRMTNHLPDDTAISIEGTDEDFTCYELGWTGVTYFPPSLDAPGIVNLSAGQEITEDHYMIARLDAMLENGIGGHLA